LLEWSRSGKPTILGAVSGGIAGLVAITPAAGYVTVLPSLAIGLIGGAVCYCSVAILKEKFGYDDSLNAFGVHGVGGIWGALATGIFATTAINPDGANGLFYGESDLFFAEIISIGVAVAFAVIGSTILYKIVNKFVELRVDESEEITGLDLVEHGERSYNLGLFSGSSNFLGNKEFETLNAFDLNHHSI
jgi:Amt family ammonium transporter